MQSNKEAAISTKRWRKEIRRRSLRKARARNSTVTEEDGKRSYRSQILDLFVPERSKARLKLAARQFVAPSVFSVSRNSSECIKFFRDIVEYSRTARRPRIVLDQRRIRDLGLGADSILGVILSEIKQELRFVYGTYIKGYKPKSKEIQKIMDEVGSVRALFMDVEEEIRITFDSKAKVFRHRHRPSDQGQETASFDPSSSVISEFSDHLNQSLSIIGRKLSVDGRSSFCHYAAEVIDNVKEHAGLNEWVVVGYSDPEAKIPTYRCVIFCFGKTIAQTFQELPEDSYPRRLIEPYLRIHRGGALFTEDWREEDLITLIALQGDVSSKSIDESSDRGQGTVELIEFFQKICGECGLRGLPTEMNIISGGTRIRYDGRYSMQFREDLNRDVIAFNFENDLLKRPDRTAVVSQKGSNFPGTLITVELPLVATFLEFVEDPA